MTPRYGTPSLPSDRARGIGRANTRVVGVGILASLTAIGLLVLWAWATAGLSAALLTGAVLGTLARVIWRSIPRTPDSHPHGCDYCYLHNRH